MSQPELTEAEWDEIDARLDADMRSEREIDKSKWTPEDHSRDQMMAYIIERRERGSC